MPLTAESQVRRSANVGISSQGVRKPGDWAPCPGATMTSTYLLLRGRGGDRVPVRTKISAHSLSEPYKNCSECVRAHGVRAGQSAQRQGDPVGVAVARVGRGQAGHLGRPAEPVADRVG